MTVKASLIIPTRNRADVLRLCLPRLLDQTLPREDYEIVVVDDASEDDTTAAVRDNSAPNVLFARNERQLAAGITRNRAIGMASGEILVFVDDDALVRRDFVEQHLATHAEHPGSIVAGPIIDVSEPPAEKDPPAGRMLGRHTNPFATCNASVARAHLMSAGGFDEDFRVYGWEDSEMYRRLEMLDLQRRYNWRAPIYHYKPPSVRRDFFARLRLEENRGAMGAVYYAKHPTFGVGFETKQLGAFRALDAVVDGLLGIGKRIEAARAANKEPDSALMRLLMINHTEIDAGRREWQRLGAARRRELAVAARAKVQPSS